MTILLLCLGSLRNNFNESLCPKETPMLFIFTAIIIAGVMSALLVRYAGDRYSLVANTAALIGVMLAGATGISAVAFVYKGWDWLAAEHQARLINQEFGTHYTQEDVFWASDVIEEIRQLDRKRIELNGDLGRGE